MKLATVLWILGALWPVAAGARTLDLLVLWRGSAGWFETVPSAGDSNQGLAVGGTERLHRVFVRGRPLELRVDAKTNTARIQDQIIPLQGTNVLLIDGVDGQQVRVAGTLYVDPQLDSLMDPVQQILKQSPLLMEFAGR